MVYILRPRQKGPYQQLSILNIAIQVLLEQMVYLLQFIVAYKDFVQFLLWLA